MKKLLLLLLIVTAAVNAQIVNIPDPVFKAKLLSANTSNNLIASTATPVYNSVTDQWTVSSYNSIDTNGDGEIQVSEALNITFLNVAGDASQNGNIYDLTGIEYFANIQVLSCGFNHLTSLNVSSNTTLTSLNCVGNQLTSLNVSSNTALTSLNCVGNQLTSLNVSSNTALTSLNVSSNTALTSLNLSSNTSLTRLLCAGNPLISLDVSNNTVLKVLACSNSQLTSLNVSSNTLLTILECDSNLLTSLNLSSNTLLTNLDCYSNQLTSLDISHNTNLQQLQCYTNQLTSLDFTHNLNLNYVDCHSNQLTSLDVTHNINLITLICTDNELTTLFVKNGKLNGWFSEFSNNYNLAYICADEDQIPYIQPYVGPNVIVNSYCSFTPGGNYNTVSGTVRFDTDSNGCDNNDLPQSYIRVNINNGTNSEANFTINSGSYSFFTQAGSFTLTPEVENSTWFNFSPTTATIPFADNNNNSATQDFCISANGVHNDVEVVIVPILRARPGFDASYRIVYKNKGTQTFSGAVDFTYNDAVLDYVSSSVNPNAQSTGSLNWNYSNLLPFESRSFNVIFNVNAPTETPAVNIGDVLNYSATINPVAGDETTADNTFAFNQIVVGAYDPNDKTCLEGDIVSPNKIGDYLHYTINFENTGNVAAENIVVKDIIDTTMFDVNTLQIMNSSHPMTTKITGDKVEFIFQNINLGASQHGNVTFKIKTNSTLVTGDSVANQADIYFDYNFPVITNTATTTFQTLSSSGFTLDSSVKIYPNPANSKININANNNIKSMQLFDIQGRILTTKIVDNLQSNFDISTYSNGVYFVKITTEKGSKVEKVIKE